MAENEINYSIESSDVEAAIDRLTKVLKRQGETFVKLTSLESSFNKELNTTVYRAKALTASGKQIVTTMTQVEGVMYRVAKATKVKYNLGGNDPDKLMKQWKEMQRTADAWEKTAKRLADQDKKRQADAAKEAQKRKSAEDQALAQYMANLNKQADALEATNKRMEASRKKELQRRKSAEDQALAQYMANLNRQANAIEATNRRISASQARAQRQAIADQRRVDAVRTGQVRTVIGGDISGGVAMGLSDRELRRIQTAYGRANAHAHEFQQRQARLGQNWVASWDFWARYLTTRVLNSVSYSFIGAGRESVRASIDFQKSISLIRTISDKSLNFNQWTEQVRTLSDTFGVAIKDVSEGVYETISNQIANGAEAAKFMATALQFAATTGSTAKQSMDLLSSVLNAFSLSASQATNVAASLFKTIDLGRVKAADMAETYGRVAPLAASVGLSFNELNASIALGTISGIKFNVSSTEILNIMNKLLKPTKEMTKLLHSWGYETGQDLVKAEGWAGALSKIYGVVQQQGTAYGAKLFGDIRAIRGFFNLTRGEMEKFKQYMSEFAITGEGKESPNEAYFKALQKSFESSGKQLEMEMNRFKNIMTVDIGQPLTEGIVKVIKNFGGLENALESFATRLGQVAVALYAWKLAQNDSVILGNLFINTIGRQNARLQTSQIELTRQVAQLTAVNQSRMANVASIEAQIIAERRLAVVNEQLAASQALVNNATSKMFNIIKGVGWFLAIEAGIRIVLPWIERQYEAFSNLNKIEADYSSEAVKRSIERMRQFDIEEQTKTAAVEAEKQAILKQYAEINKINLTSQDNLNNVFNKTILKPLDRLIAGLQNRVDLLKKAIDKYTSNIRSSESRMVNIISGDAQRSKILEMIEKIGEVDEAWNKTRISLALYQKAVNGRLNVKEQPKETQDFFKKYETLTKYRRELQKMSEEAYASGNAERGAQLTQESLAVADKLYSYGWSLNEVYKERGFILERQLKLENDYKKSQAEQVANVTKQMNATSVSMDTLKKKREELAGLVKGAKDPEKQKTLRTDITRIEKEINQSLLGAGKFDVKAIVNAGLDETQFGLKLSENNGALAKAIIDNLKFVDFQTGLNNSFDESRKVLDNIEAHSKATAANTEQSRLFNAEFSKVAKDQQEARGKRTNVEQDIIQAKAELDKIVNELGPTLQGQFVGKPEQFKLGMGTFNAFKAVDERLIMAFKQMKPGDFNIIDENVLTDAVSKGLLKSQGSEFIFDPEKIKEIITKATTGDKGSITALRDLALLSANPDGTMNKTVESVVVALGKLNEVSKVQTDLATTIYNLDETMKKLLEQGRTGTIPVQTAKDGYISKNGKLTRIADDDNVIAFRDYTAFGKIISQYLKPSSKNKFNDVFMKANGALYDIDELPEAALKLLGTNRKEAYESGKNYAVRLKDLLSVLNLSGVNYAKGDFQRGGIVKDMVAEMLPRSKKAKAKVIEKVQDVQKLATDSQKGMNAIVKSLETKPSKQMLFSNAALSKYSWDVRQAQSGRGEALTKDTSYYTDLYSKERNIRSKPINARGITSGVWGGSDRSTDAYNIVRQAYLKRVELNDALIRAQRAAEGKWGTPKKDPKTGLPMLTTAPGEWKGGTYNGREALDKSNHDVIDRNNYRFSFKGVPFSIEELKEAIKSGYAGQELRDYAMRILGQLGEKINDGVILKNGKVIRTSQDDNIYATKNDISMSRPDYANLGRRTESNRFNNPAINLNGNLNASFNVNGRQLAKEIVPFMIDDSKKGRNSLMVAK